MLRFFSSILLSLVAVLAACSPIPSKNETPEPATPYRSAFFQTNPSSMHDAFRAACDSPGDRYVEPTKTTAVCRFLPSPELAAYLLTEYDGRLEVPYMVLSKETFTRETGVEIRISYFAEVVQKTGKIQKIYKPTKPLDRRIDTLLKGAGGRLS